MTLVSLASLLNFLYFAPSYTNTHLHSTTLRSEVISHQLLFWEIFPQGQCFLLIFSGLGVSCIHSTWTPPRKLTGKAVTPVKSLPLNSHPPLWVAIVFTPGHINQTAHERGGGLKGGEGGRDGGRWSGGGRKEKRVLWPNCPLQGRHGDWVGVRRMGPREMRKHNVQSAVCVICSKTNLISGGLQPSYSSALFKEHYKKNTWPSFVALHNFGWITLHWWTANPS